MASFDISSFFTNVPLTECVNLYCDLLFRDSDSISYNECKFTREKFCKLLKFAVKDNHFMSNKQFYDQNDGVTMGSPLGLSVAKIFMCALEQKFIDKCPSDFKPIPYRGYIDATFCVCRNKEQVDTFYTKSTGNATRSLRNTNTDLMLALKSSANGQKCFSFRGAKCWNGLSTETKKTT